MQKTINLLGIIALGSFVAGMFPAVGIYFSILGFILTTVLYAKVDKLGYGTNLLNFTLYQWVVILVPTGILTYLGVERFSQGSNGVTYLIIMLVVALLLFLAFTNYFIAKSLLSLGEQTDSLWFKISGTLTKVGAFTMPILLGMLFVMLAQPFFLLGCILYKPTGELK
jgi:uncharacterized membrane protein